MTAPRRRWFRFSLRTLFVVVTAFGIWLGWQLHVVRERAAIRAWAEKREIGFSSEEWPGMFVPGRKPAWVGVIPWYRRLLGDQGYVLIEMPYGYSAADKAAIQSDQALIEATFPEAVVDDHPVVVGL
jgi:hypothetical protein